MKKLWLFAMPILLCILSCDGFTTTGSNDPYRNPCYGVSKKNAYSYIFFIDLDCPYGGVCKTGLSFLGSGVGDTLDGRCFSGYELRLETADMSQIVLENKNYPISLTSDNHAKFTLVDEDNIEKKYDIDLSGIVRSFTVRGDSVDVNVMKNCKISVFTKPHKTEIFGNTISKGLYTFAYFDSRETWFSYKCSWKQLGPLQKDDLEVYAELHWK